VLRHLTRQDARSVLLTHVSDTTYTFLEHSQRDNDFHSSATPSLTVGGEGLPWKGVEAFLDRPRSSRELGAAKKLGLSAPPTRTAPPTRFRFFDGVRDRDMT
jgi:hypothetical protein